MRFTSHLAEAEALVLAAVLRCTVQSQRAERRLLIQHARALMADARTAVDASWALLAAPRTRRPPA